MQTLFAVQPVDNLWQDVYKVDLLSGVDQPATWYMPEDQGN